MFGSIMTLGGLIGAVFSGKISDVLGRKRTMLFCEAFCAIGWLFIALAQDALWLDCGRLLLGIGVGIFSYVIPVYIAEIAPKHVRGSFVFANQLMQNCGLSLFFIIGNFIPWRILSIVGLVPCVLHVVCLFFIPESPRWLAKVGRDKECRAALQQLRGHDVDNSQEANTIRIGVGLMLLQQLSGSSGVIYYASSLYERGGFPSAIGTSVMATIMIPKALIATIIVDKMGRRTLLMASCAGMCMFALLLSVSYSFQSLGILPELTPIFTCISVLGYVITYAMGMGGLPWIIMSEIFPMNVKVSAGTLVTVTNWAIGWVITFSFNFLMQWSASGTFLIFSIVSAVSIIFIYFLMPETKGRKDRTQKKTEKMRGEIDEANLAPETSLINKENQDSSGTTTTTLLLTTFVAVSGSFVFGSAIGYSSPVQSDLTKDLNLSVAEYSLFGSILTIGAMIGAAMSGRIADLIGRRAAMGFSEMFCILGWLAIYLSKVAVWLDVGRFLVGYGMGVLSFVVPVYIAEITPKDLRGGFTTVHQLMICLGVSVAYLLGSFIGWRSLALIGMIPCVVQMMGLFIIPESPRWLAKVGRWEEFEIALQRLRGESADISYESNEIKDYTQRLTNLSEGGSWSDGFATIWRG
ncbi:MFS transporter superfamily [Arabidopsis suecica]|uniref:MFS transporter superfamily n=1 Tax=Arabidopsis suecica TaxID=45249 RepID=A0A8T2BYW9_ARASU|nr:MFS transporter superfamily [Arabidopsis suecica]